MENSAPKAPIGLLCELSSQPFGIEDFTPEMSWIVQDDDNNEIQTAYQILVASSKEQIDNNEGDLWDSGKVSSDESTNIEYEGAAFDKAQVYYWKVRTWDKTDEASLYSQPQMIVTALKDEWTAQPVWSGSGNYAMLRKEIELQEKDIDKAIAYVTGRSTESSRQYVYRFYINDALVGVGPARGFNQQVPYNTFDVTEFLNSGESNVLAATCYSYDDEKDFLLQLKIFYSDGTISEVVTDDTWKAINADNIYNTQDYFSSYYKAGAEDIDARNYPYGWKNAGYDDASWDTAVIKDAYQNDLVAQPMRSMEVVEVSPATVVDKGSGNFFFDFGKEICAGIQLTIDGTDGDVITLRLGEELSDVDTVMYQTRTGVVYEENWTLTSGTQTIANFGYRGFRYGEIVGSPDLSLDVEKIKALVIRYPFDDDASDFISSDPVLNEVWELCKYSIKAANLDVYQDCPTRERGPYEGDAYINQLSHYAVDRDFNLARYSGEYLYYNSTWPTEYKQTSVLEAWADYMATGNKDSLSAYYEILKTKTLEDYINSINLVEKSTQNDLVDWPSVYRDGYVFTEINTVINAWNYKALEGLAFIADSLNDTQNKDTYSLKAENAQNAMNTYLFNGNEYIDGRDTDHASDHANFFPLAFGIPTEDMSGNVADYLKTNGMACSVYGAQYLLEALYEADEGDYALKLMTSTGMNSWYHMIHDLNATIVTEAWDPSGKSNMSFAHAWASAPANIIPRRLFGIEPVEPGYAKIAIKPQTADLDEAGITIPSIKGDISVSVKKDSNYTITVTIPANTKAIVYVPMMETEGNTVTVDGEILDGMESNGYIILDDIGSGSHTFVREVGSSAAAEHDTSLAEAPRIDASVSSFVNNSWVGSNIIDGNPSTGWSSANVGEAYGTAQWVSIDMGDLYFVKEVKLLPRINSGNYCFPVDFTFQYSTDFENWTDIEGQSYTLYPDPLGEEQYFIFDSAVEARYLRLYVTRFKSDQHGDYYVQLGEMYAYSEN